MIQGVGVLMSARRLGRLSLREAGAQLQLWLRLGRKVLQTDPWVAPYLAEGALPGTRPICE
jgi:hypothetical protein